MTKKRVPKLTANLGQKIVKQIRLGVPSDVAARMFGVPLDTWIAWTQKTSRRYKDLMAQVDQAEAQAIADRVAQLNKLGKRGKGRSIQLWLQSRAPSHFPPRAPVSITNNTTLIEQIKIMEAREGQLIDPRLALDQAEERPALEAAPPDEEPRADVFEPNVIADARPDLIEMIRALPLPSAT